MVCTVVPLQVGLLTDLPQECSVLFQLERRFDKHCVHDKVLAGDQVEGESRNSLDGIAKTTAIRKCYREMGVSPNATIGIFEGEGKGRGGRGEGWRGRGTR